MIKTGERTRRHEAEQKQLCTQYHIGLHYNIILQRVDTTTENAQITYGYNSHSMSLDVDDLDYRSRTVLHICIFHFNFQSLHFPLYVP